MEWVIIAAVVLAFVAGMFCVRARIVAKGRRAKERITEKFGERLRLISGCGIVDPPNRVPGVLALTDDMLVYESLISLAGGEGEIPLDSIQGIRWEEPLTSRHHMARKYRKAKVLEVTLGEEQVKVFILVEREARPWQEALQALPETPETPPASE